MKPFGFALVSLALSLGQVVAVPAAHAAPCSASAKLCVVILGVDASGNVTVDPEHLHMNLKSRKVNIVWRLPANYWFDTADGDGIIFKKVPPPALQPGDEFYDNYATSKDDGSLGPSLKPRRYHWRNENAVGYKFSYEVRFRNANTIYLLDPTITNRDSLTSR